MEYYKGYRLVSESTGWFIYDPENALIGEALTLEEARGLVNEDIEGSDASEDWPF